MSKNMTQEQVKELIATNIIAYRDFKSITQQQLAHVMGVKRPQIGAYEERRATPKISFLLKISGMMGVSLGDFVSKKILIKKSIE